MASMITFAADNDTFRKRKRTYRACESCKRRRKRCHHAFEHAISRMPNDESVTSAMPVAEDGLALPLEADSDQAPTACSNAIRSDPRSHLGHITPVSLPAIDVDESRNGDPPESTASARFLGYMSPETVLHEQQDRIIGSTAPDQNNLGLWVSTKEPENVQSLVTDHVSKTREEAINRALDAYLDAIGVSLLPPREHQSALLDIYFSNVQPLLPLLDEAAFRARWASGKESRLLIQAICIVSSKHDQARPHLYLPLDPARLLKPREFVDILHAAAQAAIHAQLEKDKITLIQVLALLSLCWEGSDGAEQASMHLAQAIHQAYTLALQLDRARRRGGDNPLVNLYWCLWSLDKMNGSIHGRPVVIAERDSSVNRLTNDPAKRHTAFGIWLQLSEALDKVMELYRPGVDDQVTGWEVDFPSFEDIVGNGGDSLEPHLLAVLEIFYHSVAILSHQSRGIMNPPRFTPSKVRQNLSAVRIVSLLSDEFPNDLPPLPIIPYALSSAMSVTYRQFRQSKLQMHKNRAKKDLKTCCELLDKLRTSWWSAGAMADLGFAALNKADRTTSGVQKVRERSDEIPGRHGDQHGIRNDGRRHDSTAPATASNYQTSLLSGMASLPPMMTTPIFVSTSTGDANLLPISLPINNEQTSTSQATAETLVGPPFDSSNSNWLNFDNAFENLDTMLGSSGLDFTNELQWPLNIDEADISSL